MIKRRMKHKLNMFAGLILLVFAALIYVINLHKLQEQKSYDAADGEVVVVFNERISDSDLLQLADQYKSTAEVIRHMGDYALFSVKEASDFKKVVKSLSVQPMVLSAKANSTVSTFGMTEDPFTDTQWYIDNPGYYMDLSEVMSRDKEAAADVDMDVSEAWKSMANAGLSDREVVVAVIDTGIDYNHPDLKDHMWINTKEIPGDNIDNDNNGYIDDIYGWDFYNNDSTVCHYSHSDKYDIDRASPEDNDNHGTHVAGIIAAAANNNIGIAGIASNINIKIMSLKMTGGENGEGRVSDAIEAIKYATMMGADICNLSWGTMSYDAGLEQVIKESDMLFVAAAGNSGDDIDEKPMYPASLKLNNLISVTFIDAYGELSGYSNYGRNSVDIAAPGEDIYSTIVGGYDTMSGSSMAAPQVSAVAALLYAYNDHLYPFNIKEVLIRNLKELKSLKRFTVYGGIPDAYLAVTNASGLVQDTEAPTMSLETTFNQGEMTIPVHVEDLGGSDIRVVKWIYGTNTAADFEHGVNGTTVENNQANLSKAGTYTFYAADYAGNETAVTYEVMEDKTAPKLMATFHIADNYKTRTITVVASDSESGIKRLKYLPGIKKAEEFLPAGAGKEISLKDGIGQFKVKTDGVYTIFASDNRGNVIVKPILIRTVKSKEFGFAQNEIELQPGELYNLRTYTKPVGSTDRVTYTSSDENVVKVSPTGKVTALAEGKAYIIAKITSGLTTKCLITVKLKE